MKAVLISIKPKWCELIASGKKTLEVRKTRPKIETPIKCYIYCTKPKKILHAVWGKKDYAGWGEPFTQMRDDEKVFIRIPDRTSPFCSPPYSGKVIGEFVCDSFDTFTPTEKGVSFKRFYALHDTCLTVSQMKEYLGGKEGYGWHISELKIYDEPKEMSELRFYNSVKVRWNKDGSRDMVVRKPPQSWCYVEEVDT